MKPNRAMWMLTAALVCAGIAAPVRAQQISDARIKELIKEAAHREALQPTGAEGQQSAAAAKRPVVALSLEDAVKFALDRNLDIAVQRLNPEINDIAIASLKSIYNPNLTSTVATQSQINPSTSTVAGGGAGTPIESGLATYNGGVAQNIPWGGGGYAITLNNNRTTTTNATTLFNPAFNTNWSAQYTQPLMRGFKIDATRQQIAVTKINRDISDVQLRATITNTLSNVRNAYWDYVYALQSVDVLQQSVNLADQLVRDNQTRVQVGTMAPIDVVQAQSQAATARQNLVAAQSAMHTAELALKRLIVNGTQDPNWNVELNPTDRPDFQPEPIDIEAAVRRALSTRTDLAIVKKNVESNDVTLRYLQDQLKPQADVVAQYGYVGLGGTQLQFTGTGVGGNRVITGTVPGGYGDALSSLFNGGFPRWNVSLNLAYPLGLSSQEAAVARARVQLNQVQAQIKQIELQVATDVTNAAVTAQSNAERVQAAQAAREFTEKQLEAEQSKFEVGMSTNFNVIQAQRDLANAQSAELQAVLNYRKSLVELERLQQTTLQNLNITVLSTAGAATGATTRTTGQ